MGQVRSVPGQFMCCERTLTRQLLSQYTSDVCDNHIKLVASFFSRWFTCRFPCQKIVCAFTHSTVCSLRYFVMVRNSFNFYFVLIAVPEINFMHVNGNSNGWRFVAPVSIAVREVEFLHVSENTASSKETAIKRLCGGLRHSLSIGPEALCFLVVRPSVRVCVSTRVFPCVPVRKHLPTDLPLTSTTCPKNVHLLFFE